MARAADLAEATIETFEEFRTDAAWEHLFQYSQAVATLHNISSITTSKTSIDEAGR